MAGLEFSASMRVGMAEHFRLARIVDALSTIKDVDEAQKLLAEAAAIVAPRIRWWNIETDEGPLTISPESLLEMGPGPFGAIIGLWQNAVVTGGPAPLASAPTRSASTESSSRAASSRRPQARRTRR